MDQNPELELLPVDGIPPGLEMDIAVSALRSAGIPVVIGGLYSSKAPKQVLVPRNCLEDANLIVADARSRASASPASVDKADTIFRTVIWTIVGLVALYVLIRRFQH